MTGLMDRLGATRFERLVRRSVIQEVDRALTRNGIKFDYRLVGDYKGEDAYLLTVYYRGDIRPFLIIVDTELNRINGLNESKKYKKEKKD